MFIRMILVGVLALSLAACGGAISESSTTSYPSEVRSTFLAACTGEGGSQTRCECSLAALESSMTFREFVELELAGTDAFAADSRAIDAIAQCFTN